MPTITANMVKELREKTGAGMMDCKKALAETDGDMEKAIDELRKRGQAIASKRGGRATREGLIFDAVRDGVGVLVEVNCETDFVARNDDFKAFGENAVALVLAQSALAGGSAETLLATTDPKSGKKVSDGLTEAIAKIGENIGIARYDRIDTAKGEGPGRVFSYIHPPGKIGVLVYLTAGKPETLKSEAFEQLGRDLAMQVAATAPLALNREGVPAEAVERERAIFIDQVKQEGKPEKIWDKIVEGKVAKFYKDSCLIDQIFVKDQDLTISQLIEKTGKALGDTVNLAGYTRFAVGETAPKDEGGEE